MPKIGRNSDFTRTYKVILESYIKELNKNGADLDYNKLTEKEKLELLDILLKESKKDIIPFMKHILGSEVYWFHKKWFKNFLVYRNMCNVCSRGAGKSTSIYSTRVLSDKGYLKYKDLKVGTNVLSLNESTGKHEFRPIKHIIDNYTKPLYRVTLTSGKSIDVSMEHPFLTVNGWKALYDLKVNDFISTPRKTIHKTMRDDSVDKLKLLGYLLTKGNVNNDYSKKISYKVGLNSLSKIAIFLGVLFEYNGKLIRNGIQYNTVSKELNDDIINLLLKFGIHVRSRKKYVIFNNKKSLLYQLNITDKEFITFHENISLISKKNQADNIYNKLQNMTLDTNVDIIPREILNFIKFPLPNNKRNFTHYSLLQFKQELKKRLWVWNNDRSHIDKKDYYKYEHLNNNWDFIVRRIDYFLNGEFFWDSIKSIEFLGEQECFDLEIEGSNTHNFIGNNINIHNSYFFSGVLPTWLAFSKPDYGKPAPIFNEMIVGYNEIESKMFIGQPRKFIEENELLSNLIGFNDNTDWNKMSLEMKNNVSIKGRSFSGHLRGSHLKYIAIDDVLNDDSEVTPEQMRTKINAIILPMLRRFRGKFNMVGTLFSEDDIYHYWEEKAQSPENEKTKMYGFYKIWVELDIENKKVYLCEYDADSGVKRRYLDTGITDIYDFEDLYTAKQQEPITFAREYECKIVSDADVPFPWDDLKACCNPNFSYKKIYPENGSVFASGLDSSNSMKKDADSTVLMIGYTDKDEKKDVVSDIYENNYSTVPERLKEITKRLKYWKNAFCLAEKNSMGETNIQFLNDKSGLHIDGIVTSRQSKIDFTEYASIKVKRHEVIFPYATIRDREITDRLISQLAGVTEKRTRTGKKSFDGTTKHDDLYIAFCLMLKSLFKNKTKSGAITSYTRKDLREQDSYDKEDNIIDELRSII